MSTAGYITPPDDGAAWNDESIEEAHWEEESKRFREDTDYANGHVDTGNTDIHTVCTPGCRPACEGVNQSLDRLVEGLAADIAHLRVLEEWVVNDPLNPDTLRLVRGLVANIRESFRRHLIEVVDAAIINDVHFER